MNALTAASCLASLAAWSFMSSVHAADARPPNKLAFMASGVRLTGVDDGGGASLNYLHYLSANGLVGVGVEHQFIADSKWTFGSLRGSYGFGAPERRTIIYGELHGGEGDDDGRSFDYGVGVLGVSQSLTSKFSVQLETRQIDVDLSEGNLPKIGVTYVWTPQWATNISYAKSVSGNLGTKLTSARIDHYGTHLNAFLGGATGSAAPVVLNLGPGITQPVNDLNEVFLGLGKPFPRGELQVVGDYLESGDSERITLTLNFIMYFGRSP